MENPTRLTRTKKTIPYFSLTTAIQTSKHYFFSKENLLMLVTVISQNIIWWVYPLIYSKHLDGKLPTGSFIIVGYTLCISLALHLIFTTNFRSLGAFIFSIISILLTFSSLIKGSFESFYMLLMFASYLILIQLKWFKLKSHIGLICFSIVASFSIPLTIFYLQNNYVTNKFIFALIPLASSYLYFLTPLFIKKISQRQWTSFILGLLMLVNILLLPLNIWTILAIIITVSSWLILFNINLSLNYQTPLFLALQCVTVLLIFLQQH